MGVAGVVVLIVLYSMALDALSSPEATPRKRKVQRPRAHGSLLFPNEDLVRVQAMPFPRMPEQVARGAIVLFRRLVPLESLGETPARARGYMFLGLMHASVDDVDEAERLFRESLRILEKNHGTDKDLAAVNLCHGLTQLDRSEYAAAVRSFETAATRNADPDFRIVALSNKAGAYFALGQPAEAEKAFLDALDVVRATRQEDAFFGEAVRGNLAVFYQQLGDLESARALLEPLARGRGAGMTRVQALNSLGHLYSMRNAFAKAEECFAKAERLTPRRSQARAAVLANHAMMHDRAGDLDRAETIGTLAYDTVVASYGRDTVPAAAMMAQLAVTAMKRGDLAKAEQLLARATAIFDKDDNKEFLALVIRIEALVASRLGQHDRAGELSRSALTLSKKHFERILAFGSEMQRLEYLRETSPLDYLATIGDAPLLADAVLTMKGAVLESLLADRAQVRRQSPEDVEQFDRINLLKVNLMEMIARGENTEARELELKREQMSLVQRVGPHAERTRTTTDVASVQARLAADQVLVEIVRYQNMAAARDVAAYGAVVIAPSGPPVWIPLGAAAPIDERIDTIIGRYGGGRGMTTPDHQAANLAVALRDLHDRVWKPLRQAFPAQARRVVLSPDGATCLLPWSVLLDERERFVAERWRLTQIGSGRDLLRVSSKEPPVHTLLALGDGAADLPHSRDEIDAIRDRARSNGWTVTTLLGRDASESALTSHPRPGILHLATHAGRLQGGLPRAVQTRLSKNPMYRGYILLGGGSVSLDAWTRGSIYPFGDDGILTAEEASMLDLSETWLTVLSACQSGVGEVRAGEGVIGLRRGFALAGTENLVFSLWSVDDDSTAMFMKAFYLRLFDDDDVAGAFHATEVAELARWRRLEGIDGAVRRAGGFVLSR